MTFQCVGNKHPGRCDDDCSQMKEKYASGLQAGGRKKLWLDAHVGLWGQERA